MLEALGRKEGENGGHSEDANVSKNDVEVSGTKRRMSTKTKTERKISRKMEFVEYFVEKF